MLKSMAQTVIVKLTDDIDGGDANETVSFALNGQKYEIDLNETNAKALREALAPFIDKARVVRGVTDSAKGRRSASRSDSTSTTQDSGAKTLFSSLSQGEKERFREWAKMPTARRIGDVKVQEWIDSGRP
jgi:Lsr2